MQTRGVTEKKKPIEISSDSDSDDIQIQKPMTTTSSSSSQPLHKFTLDVDGVEVVEGYKRKKSIAHTVVTDEQREKYPVETAEEALEDKIIELDIEEEEEEELPPPKPKAPPVGSPLELPTGKRQSIKIQRPDMVSHEEALKIIKKDPKTIIEERQKRKEQEEKRKLKKGEKELDAATVDDLCGLCIIL